MNHENFSMTIILHAGNAKSYLHEALYEARGGRFDEVDSIIKQASDELLKAHRIQTTFIQEEAQDEKKETDSIPVILVHAQDHLMTVMSEKELIIEMIEMYKKQHEMDAKLDQLMEKVNL